MLICYVAFQEFTVLIGFWGLEKFKGFLMQFIIIFLSNLNTFYFYILVLILIYKNDGRKLG
jgi:hypothetical protein